MGNVFVLGFSLTLLHWSLIPLPRGREGSSLSALWMGAVLRLGSQGRREEPWRWEGCWNRPVTCEKQVSIGKAGKQISILACLGVQLWTRHGGRRSHEMRSLHQLAIANNKAHRTPGGWKPWSLTLACASAGPPGITPSRWGSEQLGSKCRLVSKAPRAATVAWERRGRAWNWWGASSVKIAPTQIKEAQRPTDLINSANLTQEKNKITLSFLLVFPKSHIHSRIMREVSDKSRLQGILWDNLTSTPPGSQWHEKQGRAEKLKSQGGRKPEN